MPRMTGLVLGGLLIAGAAQAQAPAPPVATDYTEYNKVQHTVRIGVPLLFREEWKRTSGPVEHPVTQANVASPNLQLGLYGPSGKDVQFNGGPGVEPPNPAHLWTGVCAQLCAVTLKDRRNFVDLSGLAKIGWYVRVSGLHQLRPLLKLADGSWIVGEHVDTNTANFLVSEFVPAEWRWISVDIDTLLVHGSWLAKPDLSRVDEIGFTSLMPGSGHGDGGYVDVGWIEVSGKPVPRAGK